MLQSTPGNPAPTGHWGGAGRQRKPVITWLVMVLATVSALALLDWGSAGVPNPLWTLALPSVLGLIGTVAALAVRQVEWAIASFVWGVSLVPLLLVVVLLISGP